MLARVNNTKITPDLLDEVMEMHANLPPKDRRNMETRAIRMFELLDRKGLGDQMADLATAIDFRLTALAALLSRQEVRGWTIAGDKPGKEHVHADLVQAAAEEPLIEGMEREASFDSESFRARLLGIAEAQGQA